MSITLPLDAYHSLLALAWIDGECHERELAAILRAAREGGLSTGDVEGLRAAAANHVDLDIPEGLEREQRFQLYALARWIALIDENLEQTELGVLDTVSFLLRLSRRARDEVDALVDRLVAGDPARLAPDAFDLDGMVHGIRALVG